MISVVIPSYKDPYLHKTIDSLLENSSDIEVIPVLDGYDTEIKKDNRIKPVRLKKNVGMREAINIGVSKASGRYVMRTDEHCKFGKDFDKILTKTICENWIVTPRRYKLNPETWERFGEPIDYERLIIGTSVIGKKKGPKKFHSQKYDGDGPAISEKTAMQGSCWIMPLRWWHIAIKKLEPEYGTLYQDSVEMCFKAWQAGGRLMVNKNTWYAHKARSFPRTHSYPTEEAYKTFTYTLNKWRDYYDKWIKYRL